MAHPTHYLPEPPHVHDKQRRTAILLVNLGTPDAPTKEALRRYLKQFLWDPRVVEIPRPLWWMVLNIIILNVRPATTAAKYKSIWMPEGSPLRVYTERQAKMLQEWFGKRGYEHILVDYGMRYGNPSIPAALTRLKAAGATRILVLPLYPQYAASTNATVFDDVAKWVEHTRNLPAMRFVRNYHDDSCYIATLANTVREHWSRSVSPATDPNYRLVMSFHGLPKYSLDLGDPYFCECQKTGRLLGEALGLQPEQYIVSFQSRFGNAEWLQSYTEPTLKQLGREGLKHVDVICPGFSADCLETLEEVALECKETFVSNGGGEFDYIPCLNDRQDGVDMLAGIIYDNLGNWLQPEYVDPQTAERAIGMGAKE